MGTVVVLLVVLLCKFSSGQPSEAEIDYYENLITTGRADAETYQLPTDNSQYRPTDEDAPPESFGNFDFIIVGAGCGGSVIANRLSEIKKWKILLIEAGGPESNFSIIPANHVYLHMSRFNWGYYSTPQKHSCFGMSENRCPVVRGRALGGSSAVNYESYVRGHRDDFNRWAAQGNPGWSYHEILPYFIKSENSQVPSDPGFHGRNGYWNVKHVRPISNQSINFIEGSRVLHNFRSSDYNGRNQLGAFPVQVNNKGAFRDSANAAFIQPIKDRENLKILINAYVTKVFMHPSSKKAHGVLFTMGGKLYRAVATNEVILSAGAINTPQILMLSGIGPRSHLNDLNIAVLGDLPVGKTLYDHNLFYSAYVSINLTAEVITLRQQVIEFLNDYGPLTMYSNIEVAAFYKTKFEKAPTYPDLEMVLTLLVGSPDFFLLTFLRLKNETYDAIANSLRDQNVMNVFQFVLRTESTGTVILKSDDPYEHPIIDPNFLAAQYDVDILYQGIETLKKILSTEPLRKINATLVLVDYPQCKSHELGSKDYWVCAFRLMTGSSYHQSGTCRMGPNPRTSVVDHKGKVHGFRNLRIVDISIWPSLVAGHTAAPTIMSAERIADWIKLENGQFIQPITNTIYY